MPKIFLSYAHENQSVAKQICEILENSPNLSVWMDKQELKGGIPWEAEIAKKITDSDYFVLLLSKSFLDKTKYVHREMEIAIEIQKRRSNTRFIIPTRIEECELGYPELTHLHCIDLFVGGNRPIHMLLSAVGKYGEYTGEAEIRLTAHQAVFRFDQRKFFYFINICSLSNKNTSITHVHYQDPASYISVSPESRRLPVRLEPGDVWCTFIQKSLLPIEFREDAYDKFFVRLGNGHVYRSIKEDSILSEGSVPGGGILIEDLEAESSENDKTQ